MGRALGDDVGQVDGDEIGHGVVEGEGDVGKVGCLEWK